MSRYNHSSSLLAPFSSRQPKPEGPLEQPTNSSNFQLRILLALGGVYLAVREPILLAIILASGVFFHGFQQLAPRVPFLQTRAVKKVRFWHLATLIVTFASVFAFQSPARALFLSGLEEFITTIISQSGSSIDPNAVSLVFNLIRGVFLLAVVAAALFAYNQAQQGNDWRPIAGTAAMAIGIVLAIDVITFVFVGNGGGAAGGGGGAGFILPFWLLN